MTQKQLEALIHYINMKMDSVSKTPRYDTDDLVMALKILKHEFLGSL